MEDHIKNIKKRDFKGVSGEETLKACFEATEIALRMLKASIKNNHPDFSETEIESELMRIIKMQRNEEDDFARKFYAERA
ncbi:Uncharacterised protein [uncultured archaeon]|nr:Uncharacterised protein [uncultured archaeon]